MRRFSGADLEGIRRLINKIIGQTALVPLKYGGPLELLSWQRINSSCKVLRSWVKELHECYEKQEASMTPWQELDYWRGKSNLQSGLWEYFYSRSPQSFEGIFRTLTLWREQLQNGCRRLQIQPLNGCYGRLIQPQNGCCRRQIQPQNGSYGGLNPATKWLL